MAKHPTDNPPLSPGLFALDPERLWIMHCAEGPVPLAAARAVTELLAREIRPWEMRWQEDFQALPQATRQQAAQLLAAKVDDITLTTTTSSGLIAIAQGMEWQSGDEVVIPLGEFPANAWPWKALARRGVALRQVPLWDDHRAGQEAWDSAPPTAAADPETRLLDALSPATRVLAVSWVRFQDGLKLDLKRLAKGCAVRDVKLVVDGIQGAGTQPIDLDGVSAFAAGGHKGLLAPQGLGILWTASEFRQELMPSGTWLSVEDSDDFSRPSTDLDRDFFKDGSRFEPGVPNLIGCAALEASLRVLNQAGVEAIADHLSRLRQQLISGLAEIPTRREEAHRLQTLDKQQRLASILSIHHGGRGSDEYGRVLKDLVDQGIYASVREGYLRLALHGFHTAADVDRILHALALIPQHY